MSAANIMHAHQVSCTSMLYTDFAAIDTHMEAAIDDGEVSEHLCHALCCRHYQGPERGPMWLQHLHRGHDGLGQIHCEFQFLHAFFAFDLTHSMRDRQ